MADLLDRLDWDDHLADLNPNVALDWLYCSSMGDAGIHDHVDVRTHAKRRKLLVAHLESARAKVAKSWTPASFIAENSAATALHTFDAQDPAPTLAAGVDARSSRAQEWLESIVHFDDLDDYQQWPPMVQDLAARALRRDPRWPVWLSDYQRRNAQWPT